MIVKCEQCSTRFKIPDDKVSDKGVKVRCSKCGHTFRIFKDGTIATAPTRGSGTTQLLPALPQAGAPADPFAGFGAAGDPNVEEQTRPVVFTPGVEASKNPALRPLEPSFAAQADLPSHAFEGPTAIKPVPQPPPGKAPLRTPPPAAGGDFAALFEAAARQPVAPGGFDPFAGFDPNPPPPNPAQPGDVTLPRAIDPFAATQPRSRGDLGTQPEAPANPHDLTQPRGVDPYADLFKQAPVPAASDLFGAGQQPPAGAPPPLPKSSPTQPAGRSAGSGTIPFAHAASTQAEVPAWSPPSQSEAQTVPTAQVPAYQPSEGQELPSADDFFHAEPPPAVTAQKPQSMLPDLEESQHGIEADEDAKRALFDLPAPQAQSELPQVPDHDAGVAPIGRISLTRVPVDQANRPASSTLADLKAAGLESSGAPRRRVFSVVLNVTIAAVLVVGVAILGSIWLADGKLDRQSFTSERVAQLFKRSDLVAFDISNGLYDTRGGRPVFFVRGEVENRGHHVTRVKVRAELVDGDSLLRATEVLAGATPTPEQLWSVGQGDDLDKLSQSLSSKAVDLKPGEKAAFLVPFYEYPRDLKAFRVRVKVAEAGAHTASR